MTRAIMANSPIKTATWACGREAVHEIMVVRLDLKGTQSPRGDRAIAAANPTGSCSAAAQRRLHGNWRACKLDKYRRAHLTVSPSDTRHGLSAPRWPSGHGRATRRQSARAKFAGRPLRRRWTDLNFMTRCRKARQINLQELRAWN